AYRVAAILRACGYRVYLTRNGDYYVPLAERCRIQRRHKSDLFVSIHFNAAEKKSFHGIETFALTPAGAASTSGGPPLNKRFFGNFFDANNLLLAYTIQKALLRRTGAFDRGVKRARFAVLKDIDAPGVLVEVGFVSNPREEQMMLNPAYRDKIARGIAEGIIVYHRIMLRR
ncbi:MAG: N-acetylmuramoyl-L-alanine amidase, partial [Lentisphaeria bacterium]|nr:N-acetylmuramoyl-L-alanine amidase [Lentisphaeria bacterium]